MTVSGSSNNHFIPLVAIFCVTSVAGLRRLLDDSAHERLDGVPDPARRWRPPG